jgi:uncharacterized protein YifN (PemK superfamily)
MRFKKWEVVIIEFGTAEENLDEKTYTKTEIIDNLNGVNLGKEFSHKHYGIVVSPTYLNSQKVIVLPITSKREKYRCSYDNIYCLKTEEDFNKENEKYKFLSKPSIVLINDIRSIDIKRISKFTDKQGNIKEFFIEDTDQDKIKQKLIRFLTK